MKININSLYFDNILFSLWILILFFFFLSLLSFILTLAKKSRRIRRDKIKKLYQETINHILFPFMFESQDLESFIALFKGHSHNKSSLFSSLTINSIIELHRLYKGDYQKKLENFYVRSGLAEHSLNMVKSRNWIYKVEGIRNLSELSYLEGFPEIKKHLSHKNEMVQEEALLGIIRLKGLDDLIDLIDINIYLSDWLHAHIIHIIKSKNLSKPNNFIRLLDSKNPTFQLLIARIAQYFQATEITEKLNLIVSQTFNLKIQSQLNVIVENLKPKKI